MIVKKTGRLDDDRIPVFFHNEYFVVDKIVRAVRVQFYVPEIIDVHFAFVKSDRSIMVFVHVCFLRICFFVDAHSITDPKKNCKNVTFLLSDNHFVTKFLFETIDFSLSV